MDLIWWKASTIFLRRIILSNIMWSLLDNVGKKINKISTTKSSLNKPWIQWSLGSCQLSIPNYLSWSMPFGKMNNFLANTGLALEEFRDAS